MNASGGEPDPSQPRVNSYPPEAHFEGNVSIKMMVANASSTAAPAHPNDIFSKQLDLMTFSEAERNVYHKLV